MKFLQLSKELIHRIIDIIIVIVDAVFDLFNIKKGGQNEKAS